MKDWFNKHIFPPIMKFVQLKGIIALRDGMILSLPFVMVGSIFLLLASFPVPAVDNWMNANGLTPFWNQAFNASFGIVSIFAVVGIAYTWARESKVRPLPAAMTALVGFLIILSPTTAVMNGTKTVISAQQAPTLLTGFIDRTWLSSQGLIAAIIVGLVTGWLYCILVKHHITIKLPSQVPPAVSDSFVAMIPAGIIIILWLCIYIFFAVVCHSTMMQWIYKTVQTPLQGVTDSLGGVILMSLMVTFFWLFGVHGANVVGGVVTPMLQANAMQNAAIYRKMGFVSLSNGGHIVINSFWDQFLNLTGTGLTLGIVVFILFFAKSKQLKALGKLAIIPGIFNINEPVLFGLPIVLNPMMAIPFILVPLFSMVSTYLMMKTGVLPLMSGIQIPWTVPAGIAGFICGGWKLGLWEIIDLIISFFIYYPFIKRYDNMLYAQEQKDEKKSGKNTANNSVATN